MTTISSATSAAAGSSASSGTSSSSSGSEIAGNFQEFLTLLTTQLKNQSPLDPLDTNQFTEQLVQFAGVEQQLKTNDTLTSILTASKNSASSTAASYIGLKVTSDGSTAPLANGAASWSITPPKAVSKATIEIKNASGTTVATKSSSLAAGLQTFTWNGKDANGTAQPDGSYSIAINATDASGQAVTVATGVSGTVTSVDISGATPVLTVGSSTIPLSSVKTITYQ